MNEENEKLALDYKSLSQFFLEYIKRNGKTDGMRLAASKHFEVSDSYISKVIRQLRQGKFIGRDVYREWLVSR